ncbi:MAG: CHAT domain-containing protein [Cyanomargarita calcarea GSE-NOS-MK-12-04C]|uniref:CHAT domain-containing protein n=1 Tax=Cyanomargarita calcarea GSE-NOS-MK-12-04C TaxID=2839659 RepID=A0A951QP54_9CYAN|nr:CHAT domain-containing protein [Cyanomargarita calcarea GSE-NOS-MK-12-04C]
METLKLYLSPLDTKQFKVIVTTQGEVVTSLPFFDGEIDRRTTLIKVLEASRFQANLFQDNEQDWMVKSGILSPNKKAFHQDYLKNIGKSLYKSLFPQQVEKLLSVAIEKAGDKTLLIRLTFPGNVAKTRLADYPWELLHDDQRFLLHSNISIYRYIAYPSPLPSFTWERPVNVLLISPTASYQTEESKKAEETEAQSAIRNVLKKAKDKKYINFEELKPATHKQLIDYLNQHQGENAPHVLHFNGHGLFGRVCLNPKCRKTYTGSEVSREQCRKCGQQLPNPQGYLVFQDEEEKPDYISAEQFGAALEQVGLADGSNKPGRIALVVLTACQSAMAVTGDSVFNGTAQNLIGHRIPAVVAMQYSVEIPSATKFTEDFYRSLVPKNSLIVATNQARVAMGVGGNQWYRPVLYMRVNTIEPGLPPQQKIENAEAYLAEKELLDRYLHWLIEQNCELELPGLPGGKYHPVELETVYVALRGDLSNPYEREQSQAILEQQARQKNLFADKELTKEQEYQIFKDIIRSLALAPIPVSIEERDRPHLFNKPNERTITLGEAVQQERRLVILGDPGSGKTTLCRWLVLKLARAYLLKKPEVLVPIHHVNPAADETDELVSLGSTRIPIFVRVASFANARNAKPQLRLAQFLGHHLGSDYENIVADSRGRKIDSHTLNKVFLNLFETGRVILLLDGLDEIANPTIRSEIVKEIDLFIKALIPDNVGSPCDGGNQVIITSRIVGYQMAPLSNQSAHLTIEPMSERAINRFCDVWMKAIHKVSIPPERWNTQAETAAIQEATELKGAIADLQQRGAGDLASNPLLITILALIFRNGQKQQGKASFPQQRVKLYETAVNILIDKWRERAIRKGEREFGQEEVIKILVPLAAHIHETSNIGVVNDDDLEQILKQHLSNLDAAQFQQVVREEVGLLAARGEGVYGFLHLTFQEYLAGYWLIEQREGISERLLEKLSSPRWREPILMALGQLSVELNETTLQTLLLEMLNKPDTLGHLVPRTILLFVAALPEMVKVPDRVVEELTFQLLRAYAQRTTLERFPLLREQLEQAFCQLTKEKHFNIVERVLRKVLAHKISEHSEQIFASVTLMRISRCYTIRLARALADIWIHDSEEWNWPIDNALRDIAVNFPDLLPDKPGSLRSKLLTKPKLAEKFLANPMWVRLGIAIYGGFDTSISKRITETKDKIAQINYEQQQILNIPQSSQSKETIERLNKDLAEWNATLENLKNNGHQFSIKRIHRDSSLTPLLLEALQNERSPDSLIPKLWEKWKSENSLIVKIDICLALAALGEPIAPILQKDIFLTQQVISHILRLIRFLENVVQSASSATIKSLKELGGCTWEHWTDLVVATLNVRLAFQQEPYNLLELEELAHELYKPLILAETLQYFFSGANDDPVYNLAVVIDTDGNQLSNPPIKLAQALANTYLSTNSQWNKRIGWSLEKIPPRAVEQLDILAAALDALVTIPKDFDFFRGWLLVQLAPLLQENGLVIEAIIIAVSLSDKFQARSETIEVLIKFQENLSDLLADPYPEISLLQALQTIDDPYLRFRGYLRLMENNPFFQIPFVVKSSDFSEFNFLIVNAQEAAYAIKDFSRKEWAFEQLAWIGHSTKKLRWLQQAVQVAEKVSDFENRARAYARLASYFSLEQGLKLFLSALDNVKKIPDIRKKTETLVLFRESLNRYPQAYSCFQEAVSSLDTWNQAKALGFNAPLFQKYVTELGEINNETTSLVLGAIFNDLQLQFSLPHDLGRLWSALLSTQKLFALEALCQRAKKKTLLLTQEATAALNQLIKEGDVETVSRLIPLVQSPDSRSIPILEDWLVHLDPLIKQYIYLLIAEAGKISEQTVPTLIELLTCSEDRTRYRAALALHGNRFNSILLKTSTLGVNTLLELAQKSIELLEDNSPQFSLVIAWAFERIYHNNGQIIETLVQISKSHTVDSEKALLVLRHIKLISANVWLIFLKELREGTSEIQGAFLHSLCMLLARNCITERMWQEALLILRNVNSEVLEAYEFILDQPAKLVESASLAWETLKDNSKVVSNIILEAENIFTKHKQNLLEVLQNEDSSILKNLLASVGNLYLANQSFTDRINSASASVEQKPQLLEILITWLEIKLQENPFEQDFKRFMIGDLLCVVAACAERLPNTFYNKVSSSSTLQTRLLEVVEYHNTFPGRQAALVLLSYFYSVTEETIAAFKVALRDVIEVQDVAIQTIDRYREIDPNELPQLFEDLLDLSPAVGFATAQMLAVIARNVYLKPYLREEIIRAFVKAIDDDFSKRDVYLFVKEEVPYQNHVYRIKYKGQLDEIFYKIVTQLSGITDIGKRKGLVSEDNTI